MSWGAFWGHLYCANCVGNSFVFFFREAWKSLGDKSKDEAMIEYAECVEELDPEYNPEVS